MYGQFCFALFISTILFLFQKVASSKEENVQNENTKKIRTELSAWLPDENNCFDPSNGYAIACPIEVITESSLEDEPVDDLGLHSTVTPWPTTDAREMTTFASTPGPHDSCILRQCEKKFYFHTHERTDANAASAVCLASNCTLVHFYSRGQFDHIVNFIKSQGLYNDYWIGATWVKSGVYQWQPKVLNGRGEFCKVSFNNWGPGQPFYVADPHKYGACVVMRRDFSWALDQCEATAIPKSFICESLCPDERIRIHWAKNKKPGKQPE